MRSISYEEGNVLVRKYGYEDYSEPLKEYTVLEGGRLEPTMTSETLLGVRKNGKWGWIDCDNNIMIPFDFDSGFVTCYNGIIILRKYEGAYGGLFRKDLTRAFDFCYGFLSHIYNNTYMASRSLWGKSALLKPGDIKLTDYIYLGFMENGERRYTSYKRYNFLGIEVTGEIDLETGREIS